MTQIRTRAKVYTPELIQKMNAFLEKAADGELGDARHPFDSKVSVSEAIDRTRRLGAACLEREASYDRHKAVGEPDDLDSERLKRHFGYQASKHDKQANRSGAARANHENALVKAETREKLVRTGIIAGLVVAGVGGSFFTLAAAPAAILAGIFLGFVNDPDMGYDSSRAASLERTISRCISSGSNERLLAERNRTLAQDVQGWALLE